MEDVYIKKCTDADIETVRNILHVTWLATYAAFIPETDLLAYLDSTYSPVLLRGMFRAAGIENYLAGADDIWWGYMRTKADEAENKFYISSLYVLPSAQGKGIGNALLIKAFKEALAAGFDRVWLGVMSENTRSIDWYKKKGFTFDSEEPFRMGSAEVLHLIGSAMIPSYLSAKG